MLLKTLILFNFISLFNLSNCVLFNPNNNACTKLKDYLVYATSKNCLHIEDGKLTTPEIIKKYVNVVETHMITTKDGYILTMFRLPAKNPLNQKGVIMLQHSAFVDSKLYVAGGVDSLPFYLWNENYEVWMNNMRGTEFSLGHTKYNSRDYNYWQFSYDEIGLYDIPAQIRYIRNVTEYKTKIKYIGHSLGTVTGLIYGSVYADEAKEAIDTFVMMGTAGIAKYNKSVFVILSKFESILRLLTDVLRQKTILPIRPFVVPASEIILRVVPGSIYVVYIFLSVSLGWSKTTDLTFYSFDIFNYFQQISWHTMLHILQYVKTQTKICYFNFGKSENLKRYGQETPPSFPLEKFSVPILFIKGTNDVLTASKDAEWLANNLLPKNLTVKQINAEGFNHIDYEVGLKKTKLYKIIVDYFTEFN